MIWGILDWTPHFDTSWMKVCMLLKFLLWSAICKIIIIFNWGYSKPQEIVRPTPFSRHTWFGVTCTESGHQIAANRMIPHYFAKTRWKWPKKTQSQLKCILGLKKKLSVLHPLPSRNPQCLALFCYTTSRLCYAAQWSTPWQTEILWKNIKHCKSFS